MPWPDEFPEVLVHGRRDRLTGHRWYEQAKQHRDVARALCICRELAQEDILYNLFDIVQDLEGPVIVVAPARPPLDTGNALSRTFAGHVARELYCEYGDAVRQTNAVKRDFITNPYTRLTQAPTFRGPVVADANYILADDVFTFGGTLAALRGFLTVNGGRVVAVTTLAEKEGNHVPISLAKDTLAALYERHHGALAELVPARTGFDLDCLTEAEGRFLLKQPSADAVRNGFDRAGDR